MSIPVILHEHGCEPEPILGSLSFKLSQFDDPDNELPFIPTSRLIARCVDVTGCEHFGLLMGMRAEPSSLGIAGFMLLTAHDVDTALHALKRHLDLHDQGGVLTLSTDGEFTALGYAVHLSGVSATAQIYDMSIVLACKIMRNLCGEDWNPAEVLLSRPPPQDPAPYDLFFKAPIRFNATGSAVVFPTHWLQHKLPSHDLLLFDYLERKAAELHQDKKVDLINQLHRFVRIALVTQDCTSSAAAQHLGIHERTLNRRLHDQGTTFRNVVNEVRYAMAQSFLANSEATNAEIALALGYTDATTFSHAFKRWSGMSPAQWRERQA
jgi:AraC-like DNA-binding protein